MKTIYTFGNGKAEGSADMRDLLGGKGANLAEMNLIGVPVPPGFTITTEMCRLYNEKGRDEVIKLIKGDVEKSIAHIESLTGNKFNDPSNPQLVSVRSGAPVSMPGMMDTVLNLGINDEVAATLAEKSGNPRFAWDSYRRFVQMYGDVVLGMKPENKTDIEIKDVTFGYDSRVILDKISAKIPAKSKCAIVGYSGSGKTTLLRCINSLEIADSGKIVVDDGVIFDS
jgi:pyruvate,orthophosphate dikinase